MTLRAQFYADMVLTVAYLHGRVRVSDDARYD